MHILSASKGSPHLYKQVLKHDLWKGKHNNPTHDSFHGNFVQPFAEILMPKQAANVEKSFSTFSATKQPQLALAFPYL